MMPVFFTIRPAMTFNLSAFARPALFAMSIAVLAGCATGPASNITLIPDATDELTSREGLFAQTVKWKRSKPDCKGECPSLEVNTLVFAGYPELTELVDHALAMMTGINDHGRPPYDDIASFEDYYWQVAGSRDSVLLAAKLRYRSKYLTVIELDSWQYLTGAAHGIGATQFLNWDNARQAIVPLDHILTAGGRSGYEAALKRAHARWLEKQPDAQADPQGWNRLWPFQPNDNFAFTDQGLVVKYDTYQLAPYSHGQPELEIPYSELEGILKVDYMPMRAD